jgi:hypothetical protein
MFCSRLDDTKLTFFLVIKLVPAYMILLNFTDECQKVIGWLQLISFFILTRCTALKPVANFVSEITTFFYFLERAKLI